MEIWKEPGQSGKVYHVFPTSQKKGYEDEIIAEAARYQKIARARMEVIPVYLTGDSLHLEPVKGRKKALAVVRKAGA